MAKVKDMMKGGKEKFQKVGIGVVESKVRPGEGYTRRKPRIKAR